MAHVFTVLQGVEERAHNGTLDLGSTHTHEIGSQVVIHFPETEEDRTKAPIEAIVSVMVSNNAKDYTSRGKISLKGTGNASECKEFNLPYKYIRLYVEKLTKGALLTAYVSQ
jgi:hypothetical protein